MAPAPPHTTKQCTRAPPPALVRLVAAIVPRLQGTPCRGRLAPRFVLRLSKGPLGIGQGTPNRLWLPTFKVPLTSMWTGHHAFSEKLQGPPVPVPRCLRGPSEPACRYRRVAGWTTVQSPARARDLPARCTLGLLPGITGGAPRPPRGS